MPHLKPEAYHLFQNDTTWDERTDVKPRGTQCLIESNLLSLRSLF